MKGNPALVKQFSIELAESFPDYIQFSNILNLSEITWHKYGLSAESLMQMTPWEIEMLIVKLNL